MTIPIYTKHLLDDTHKKLCEVKAKRNFDIIIEWKKFELSIILQHNNGKSINLNKYIDSDYTFQQNNCFNCKRYEKIIQFDANFSDYRVFLLVLFHEIGHSHFKKLTPNSIADNIKAIKYTLKKAFYYLFEKWKILPKTARAPDWLIMKENTYKAEDERYARAFALKRLRALEKEWFDVFNGFDDTKTIHKYINFCLLTYENRKNTLLSNTGANPNDYKFLFTRYTMANIIDNKPL